MWLRSAHITISFFCAGLLCGGISFAQPCNVLKAPSDDFSKNLIFISKDALSMFSKTKGRLTTKGDVLNYVCRKKLPGALASYITGGENATCIFYFGTFSSLPEAEATVQYLNDKVNTALLKQTLIKHIDSTGDPLLVKRIAIAEIIDDGYYGYNICIDIDKKPGTELYNVMLKIKGGEGVFYRFVFRNQPFRSSEFRRTFNKMYAQFDGSDYHCADILPGFTCTTIDSSGKQQLLMEKKLFDFPDARVEFECLTSNIRAVLSEKFLYYLPATDDTTLREAVFIRVADDDKAERKSISTSLVKNSDGIYSVRALMYHP